MNINQITIMAAIALTGCNYLNLDDQNDTQLGDDDGGGTGGVEDPNQVPDHGYAQYCVDRWSAYASATGNPVDAALADRIAIHERWWSPPTRSYVNHLDISDKPSPMIVPPMCGAFDPLWVDEDLAGASCLVSGYHVPLPSVVTAPDPGGVQWPYGANIVTGTIGNPPESGRHTWMAEPCCSAVPSVEEIAEWIELPGEENLYLGNRNADCALHAMFKGARPDTDGYYSPLDTTARRYKTAQAAQCVNNHGEFNPAALAPFKAAGLGTWLPMHPTRQQHTAPLNLNYDWVSSWGLIEWEDFAAFGQTIDAIVAALLSVLYLPPDDFEHPRYGGGSGCWYPATLKYGPSGWQAEITCPYGYFERMPPYDTDDLGTQIDGVVGNCALDGYGGGPAGDGGGPVVAAPPNDPGSFERLYYVTDLDPVVAALEAAWSTGLVTAELASMFNSSDGAPALSTDDRFVGYSTPGVPGIGPGEALRRTVGYDVDDLMAATGWTRDRAEKWTHTAGPVLLSVLLPDVPMPPELAERHGHELRAYNTWRFRVHRADGFMVSFYVRAAR